MSDTTFIYALIDPRNNRVKYIGKANNPEQRLYAHVSQARWADQKNNRANWHKIHWIRQVLSEELRPRILIIQKVTVTEWEKAERFWIAFYRAAGANLVNASDGGEGVSNPSAETRAHANQMSRERMLSDSNPMKNPQARKNYDLAIESKELRQRRREAILANNPMSNPDVRERHKAAVNREDVRKKKSEALRGDKHPMRRRPELRQRMMGDSNIARRADVREKLSKSSRGRPNKNKGKALDLPAITRQRLSEGVKRSWLDRRKKKRGPQIALPGL